jgi:hypothetical protein
MTLAKRLEAVEDNLTPQEAVIRWIREAHEFGSMESYARWLIDQPDDVYPLIRMPQQVVGAVKARNKGVPDIKLRPEFYRVQKDVLFLYFLHKMVEMKALIDHEAIQLRVLILVKEIRALINEKHALDQMRLARVDLDGKRHRRPGKVEKTTSAIYEDHVRSWAPETEEVAVRILGFLAGAQLISRRYFAGADIIYPATRENLKVNLETIANLREIYEGSILGAPESDDDFRDYALALAAGEAPSREGNLRQRRELPDATGKARLLAEQWVIMAKSETLEKLGEHREAEALADQLARQVLEA